MPAASPELQRLKKATDLHGVAALLNVKPSGLSYALYYMPPATKYRSFTVPKKRGGTRTISAPHGGLKYIQKQLATLLLSIEKELEGDRRKNSILAHGFKKELSIITNAIRHRNKRWVFNIDLRDFFPSINFGRVRGFFIANNQFALTPKTSTILAQLACHDNVLPQGSPCSPPISNLIAGILDYRLNRLARECNCTYTRYADDITFSTNEPEFPERIAVLAGPHAWQPSEELASRIASSGFEINPDKTRMQYRDSRQDTTGLIVNRHLNVPVEYWKQTRAMCHRLFVDGQAYRVFDGKKEPISLDSLRGRLNFIYYIRSLTLGKANLEKPKGIPGYRKVFARFLNYNAFWSIEKPVIVCEGKTDGIYLRSAIRSLHAKFPDFFETVGGKVKIRPTFFKYTTNTREVQDLSGGNGQLKNLVAQYAHRTKGFKGTPKAPVIIVTDCDKGAVHLFEEVSKILGRTVAGADPFYYLHTNLYVVPVPKLGLPETAIEDLFDKTLLDIKIDGKTFDKTNHEKDGAKFYSKFTFATKVIAASKVPVDYSGFEPLLQAMLDVEADYAARLATVPPTVLPAH